MSKKVFAFFSSDAREKYKSDIFRTLALPHKYVIHFRYQTKYIQPKLLSNLNTLLNKEGVIFYANGNDTNKDKDKREITFLSIRNVIIKDIYRDDTLDLVNFYLELSDFVDCKFIENTPKELVTPNFSVSEIEIDSGQKNKWGERVNLLQNYLKNTLYYFINSVRQGNTELEPKYSKLAKESFYELNDESDYQIYFSVFDPSNGEYGLEVKNSGDTFDIDIPYEHKVAAPRDTELFVLHTHTLQVLSKSEVTTYSIRSSSPTVAPTPMIDLSVKLHWKIIKKFWNIVLFGIFSIIAAIGLALAALASTDLSKTSFTMLNIALAVISALLIGFAASLLFWMFNKQ